MFRTKNARPILVVLFPSSFPCFCFENRRNMLFLPFKKGKKLWHKTRSPPQIAGSKCIVVILLNWVPDDWVYRFPTIFISILHSLPLSLCTGQPSSKMQLHISRPDSLGAGKRVRGLFTGGISSCFSRISRVSKFSRKWTSLKRPLSRTRLTTPPCIINGSIINHIVVRPEKWDASQRRDATFCLQLEASRLQWSCFCLQLTILAFYLQLELFTYNCCFFTYSWSFFAYSGKVRPIHALRNCKQRSLTVGKKAPTVSKKASPQEVGFQGSNASSGRIALLPFYPVFSSVSELRRTCFHQARIAQAVLLPGVLFTCCFPHLPGANKFCIFD